MTLKFRNRGTKIEEEDFCHWTEKDVDFKCFEGLNAKLKKFHSWNKAIMIQIEIDGTLFCGCLFQDNNSFAPVKFGPPKRPPLPRITPSKPRPPPRKKSTNKAPNAYSRENWPRVYIDSRNTVEQRLRSRKDKNDSSDHRSGTSSRTGAENSSRRRPNKVGVLVYGKRKKRSCCDQKLKNSVENSSRLRRSKRRLSNSYSGDLQRNSVNSGYDTESNNTSSALGEACVEVNKSKMRSTGCEGKKHYALGKTSSSSGPNLRPRGAKKRSEPELIYSALESNETLSGECLSSTESDEVPHQTDVLGKSIESCKASAHQVSPHRSINSDNKERRKFNSILDPDAVIPDFDLDKTLESTDKENDLPKSTRSKQRRRREVSKECCDLADKFEEMAIGTVAFGQPVKQSSPKRELNFHGTGEEELSKTSATEMQSASSANADSKPTNIPKHFRF